MLQQQVLCALLSAEQPQILQSPLHSLLKVWGIVFEFMARDKSGLNAIIR
jgi:hypothetical protein